MWQAWRLCSAGVANSARTRERSGRTHELHTSQAEQAGSDRQAFAPEAEGASGTIASLPLLFNG